MSGYPHHPTILDRALPCTSWVPVPVLCAAAGGELTVSDLIAGLGDSRGKLGAARTVLEKKAAPVAAPLPGPIRQRQERKAG